jgi:hypothetical protein
MRQVAIPLVAFTIGGGGSFPEAVKAATAAALRAIGRGLLKGFGHLAQKAAEAAASVAVKWGLGLVGKVIIAPVLIPVVMAIFSHILPPSSVCASLREEEGPDWSSQRCPLPRTSATTESGASLKQSAEAFRGRGDVVPPLLAAGGPLPVGRVLGGSTSLVEGKPAPDQSGHSIGDRLFADSRTCQRPPAGESACPALRCGARRDALSSRRMQRGLRHIRERSS